MKRIIILSILVILLCGCGVDYHDQRFKVANDYAEQHKWINSYEKLEILINSESEDGRLKTILNKYPEILTTGSLGLFRKRLKLINKECNANSIHTYFYNLRELHSSKLISDYHKQFIYKESQNTINNCVAKKKSGVWLSKVRNMESFMGPGFFNEDALKQATLTEENEKRMKIGTIIDVQVVDRSYTNPQTGSKLGAILGQARYIDNSSVGNYSATSQIGAGIAGALIGAMLDSPAEEKYRLTYFVKEKNGDLVKITTTSPDQTYLPNGACVEFRKPSTISITNQIECTGTL